MKNTAKIFAAALALLAAVAAYGKTIEVKAPSAAMKKEISALVILPDSYDADSGKSYPTIYLLHGFGGNHTSWVKHTKPNLDEIASQQGIIFVCPDGAKSWYWDAPQKPEYKYETFVSKELVEFIDKNFRTVKSPKARAITGLSMGGHGGLWLGIRHQDVFGACGSMSGGVDIRPFPSNWEMKESLGSKSKKTEVWDSHTVINEVDKIINSNAPAIIIDCGTKDFFYEVNQALHEKLLYLRIPHEYITRPGAHTHDYWNNAVDFQILFFKKFFGRNNTNNKK